MRTLGNMIHDINRHVGRNAIALVGYEDDGGVLYAVESVDGSKQYTGRLRRKQLWRFLNGMIEGVELMRPRE